MHHHDVNQPDFGTGQKKLSIYLLGFIICSILTLISFWVVMAGLYTKWEMFTVIYSAACIQFFVQLVCFLRLNIHTQQGKTNVMSIIFTGVILTSIVVGSLWIMWNLHYHMM